MVIVHLWGMPSKINELQKLAHRYGLKIVEDASHAHGATYQGRKCGTFGDISVFSLQSSKLAPAGEGGMLLTNHDGYIERAICLGDMMRILELPSPISRIAGTTFGIKTRMAPLSAAVARVQFRHMPERNTVRNANLVYLSERLERLGFHTYLPPAGIQRVYFEYLIRMDPGISLPREILIEGLRAEGCDVSAPRYPLLHQQPLFTEGLYRKIARLPEAHTSSIVYKADALPKTEAALQTLLRLPAFPAATRELLDQYALAFEKVVDQADEILNTVARTPRPLYRSNLLEIADCKLQILKFTRKETQK
jgi:perosamine synthetase